MTERNKKNDNSNGQTKKTKASQKTTTQKRQPAKKTTRSIKKTQTASEKHTDINSKKNSTENNNSVAALTKKINDISEDIEKTPLASLEKSVQSKLIKTYEKLIRKLVKEINSTRK